MNRRVDDKVFLLSAGKADTYFHSNKEEQCIPTAYAKANGALGSDNSKSESACPWYCGHRVNISIRESNPVALKALFSPSSGVFLLAIQKYWRVEETPDYLKTKAFRVLRSFKMSYFCRYKKKTKQCFRLARLFDAVTAKRGLFKTVLSSTLLCLTFRNLYY